MKTTGTASGIYAAQVEALYQHIPMVLIVNMVNAALVAIVLASYLGQSGWLLFLALAIALTGLRAIEWACYRRCHRRHPDASAKWAIAATVGSGLCGLLWGAGSALWLPDNLFGQTFVAFVIGGMCIASLVAFSNYLPAFIAYVFPASLPLAGRFFLDGWMVHGDMMVVFAAAVTLAAYHSTRVFVNGLRLNLDLTDKTEQLTNANARLQTEIEQRRVAEDQLRQAHKMEAVGQLTGGIAHDFNNLLTAIIGHLEIAEDRVRDNPRVMAPLQAALRAAERGAALTRHLLAFARRQQLEPRAVCIASIIEGVVKILEQAIGPEVRLVTRSQPDLRSAWADPNQLELAILNLALNARDAMAAGGTLSIEAQNRRADCDLLPPELAAADYVVVSVSDTGTGMNQATLERVFEPFFTTKEVGRGSGLGLSIVHGFAAQSGGMVQIDSRPGEGTQVDLWLPCAPVPATSHAEGEPDPLVTIPEQARILVCDDDPAVLAFVGSVLREAGCTVFEAETPCRALEIVAEGWPLDLLLVDYAMPEMNGVAVIDRARSRQRGLRALLMSGHADVLHAGGAPGIPLLAKPFKVAELRRRIAELLAGEPVTLDGIGHRTRHFALSP
jgi:signal transduction histidine kinase/CheY-like chemotaxis protein